MASLLEKIERSGINRRQFVGLAATAGVVTTLGLTGCENKVTESPEGASAVADPLTGGEWKTYICYKDGCTNNCVNQAYVVDGVMIRSRTDETHPDSPETPQFRSCIKGHAVRFEMTNPNRLKYPMKRKSWQPGGGANSSASLRGRDEWERISWDQATEYIVSELTRIRDTYGNRAFLGLGYQERKISVANNCGMLFNVLGGCIPTYGVWTNGGTRPVSGFIGNGYGGQPDKMQMRDIKLHVAFGCNPAWTHTGQMYSTLNAKKAGSTKTVVIEPWFNTTAQAIADQWIPIHPGTDGALVEALAYELITNNWVDQDFLNRCCVGFDADHMPADAKTNENYKDYILGAYDGVPKTPEWATPICGIPEDTIRQLAKDMGTTDALYLSASYSVARSFYGSRWAHQCATLAWMCGAMGKPGSFYSFGSNGFFSGDDVDREDSLYTKLLPKNPIGSTTLTGDNELTNAKDGRSAFQPGKDYGMPFPEVFKAIATGEYTSPSPDHKKTKCEIRAIYHSTARNWAQQVSGINWAPEAYRKESVEFVLAQEFMLKGSPVYCDIVLPIKSHMELDFVLKSENTEGLTSVGTKAMADFYEAKDDVEIYCLLLDAFGIKEDIAPRTSQRQCQFERLASSTIAKSGGERENLLTITQEDLDYFGLKWEPEGGLPQQGMIPLREFIEEHNGIHQVARTPNDGLNPIRGEKFRNDPEGNPLSTPSGKLEIYCQSLKDHFDLCMLCDIDAIPKYKASVDGFESIAESGDYKYQFLSIHHMRGTGTCGPRNRQISEVYPNDLMMNTADAEKEGLKSGDWVLAHGKDAGTIARRLNVVPHVIPGTVVIGHGNWLTVDDETGIDIGGNPNYAISCKLVSDGFNPYNSALVKIERYTGKELTTDFTFPYVVPLAE
jgi:anaerobic dimethyl sulfoxide reductase subunit A